MFRFNRRLSFLFRPSSRDRLVHYVTLGYAVLFSFFGGERLAEVKEHPIHLCLLLSLLHAPPGG